MLLYRPSGQSTLPALRFGQHTNLVSFQKSSKIMLAAVCGDSRKSSSTATLHSAMRRIMTLELDAILILGPASLATDTCDGGCAGGKGAKPVRRPTKRTAFGKGPRGLVNILVVRSYLHQLLESRCHLVTAMTVAGTRHRGRGLRHPGYMCTIHVYNNRI